MFASRLGPDQLREVVERELSAAMRSPVTIERVQIRLGRGLVVQGLNAETWLEPASRGLRPPGLYVGRVDANLDLLALLSGRFAISGITLINTVLQVDRSTDGTLRPAPIAALFALGAPAGAQRASGDDSAGEVEELLRPLFGMRRALLFLLQKPFVARVWKLHNGTISFRDASAEATPPSHSQSQTAARAPHELHLVNLDGEFHHKRGNRGARVSVRGRLRDTRDDRGTLEWLGTRGGDGAIRTTIATTGFDLAAFLPYARASDPAASLEGVLSGAIAYEFVSSSSSRLDVDVIAKNLKTDLLPGKAVGSSTTFAAHTDAHIVIDVGPDRVKVLRAQYASGQLDLKAKGTVDRPLHASSVANLSVSFHDVELAPLFDRLGWLPLQDPESAVEGETQREPPSQHENIEAGRLATLTARGAAPISVWQDFFGGQTSRLPAGFAVDGEVIDALVRVGESDQLERINGHITWSGDQVRVTGVEADLNGSSLPVMDLTVDGISHLFATRSDQRALRSGGTALVGLGSLWGLFQADASGVGGMATTVWLQVDHLEHPMFLWPLRDLWATIEPTLGGIHLVAEKGNWAGAAIDGDADWIFEPEERISIRLRAEPGDLPPLPPGGESAVGDLAGEPHAWAKGRFTVGAFESESWHHRQATGSFTASAAVLQVGGLQLDLEPTGSVGGSGSLDLGHPEEVPIDLVLRLNGGDLGALGTWMGLEPDEAAGRLDLSGRFEGSLRPETPLLRDIRGHLSVAARDGSLKRGVPPIVSVALSSNAAANPFASREQVRFDRIDTTFDFQDGVMRTDAFLLDGPDLRIFASGKVNVASEPNDMDVEVAVFLFRVIDRALEKIPLIRRLVLGEDESFLSAYYQLTGPWDEPEVKLFPMKTLASGPASLLLERMPRLLKSGFEALGSALRGEKSPGEDAPADRELPKRGPNEF